ncbi:hypothetical protein [Bacillus phage DZ1]|uniref:Uncharacterized protein n=1 Tax=Bacillus phage DZ1 TaxID=3075862 RepID=A0AA96J2T4_9CAUD|nr:hypothetical protein [Bacillus phage DZ1]
MRKKITKQLVIELSQVEAASLLRALEGGQYHVDVNSDAREHIEQAISMLEDFIGDQ